MAGKDNKLLQANPFRQRSKNTSATCGRVGDLHLEPADQKSSGILREPSGLHGQGPVRLAKYSSGTSPILAISQTRPNAASHKPFSSQSITVRSGTPRICAAGSGPPTIPIATPSQSMRSVSWPRFAFRRAFNPPPARRIVLERNCTPRISRTSEAAARGSEAPAFRTSRSHRRETATSGRFCSYTLATLDPLPRASEPPSR
jgi:hypothetical protein